MLELLTKTVSQSLQAFLPVAVALGWLQRHDRRAAARVVRFAVLAGVLLSPVAASLLQASAKQSQVEATLACLATAIAVAAVLAARRSPRAASGTSVPVLAGLAGATLLLVVRQTMEIAAVVRVAVLDVRSLDATLAAAGGLLIGIVVAWAWNRAARAAPLSAAASATIAFGVLFAAQAALYAFHESAESRWLPWSEVLHAATEAYGPDGAYGPLGSYLVAGLPIVLGIAMVFSPRWRAGRPSPAARRWTAGAGIVSVVLIAGLFVALASGRRLDTPAVMAAADGSAAGGGGSIALPGQLLFRRTSIQQGYGRLTLAPLGTPAGASPPAPLECERVSFAAGRGLCLQASRGLFTTYRAVLFDERMQPLRSLDLGGSPSRTRVSPDGRLGAFTVFDTSVHSYASTTFSTITTLVDMATGDSLGNLEAFSTWRDGARIKAADFNFWGVTFARDPNTFYATLSTGGKTYLVRGDLGLRKLTVLRENVECPSMSPDNRLIAFKKRVGPATAPWRIYLLDLASMTEHPLVGESRSIDDQIEWLDDGHVLYVVPRDAPSAVTDVWVAPVDGSAPAQVFLAEAESPIVIR